MITIKEGPCFLPVVNADARVPGWLPWARQSPRSPVRRAQEAHPRSPAANSGHVTVADPVRRSVRTGFGDGLK